MYFANNLQFLRKQHSMTQEDLADYLGVSRQSISKWEMGSAYPETDKLIAICDKFNVTLDALVRADLTSVNYNNNINIEMPQEQTENQREQEQEPTKVVHSDIWGYKQHVDKFSRAILLGVFLVLMGVSLCCFITGACEYLYDGTNVDYSFLGPVVLLLFISVAVFLFVFSGIRHAQFIAEKPNIENVFDEEEKRIFNKKFTTLMATFIPAILLDVVALVVASAIIEINCSGAKAEFYETMCAGVFLFILAFIVSGICYLGMQKAKFDMSILEDKHQPKKGKKVDALCGVIMLTATAIFLTIGFVWGIWHPTWVVFPVGGIICGIVSTIFGAVDKE